MNTKRLTDLINVLKELTPAERTRFDVGYWAKRGECGTAACAAGWYCMKRPNCGMALTISRHTGLGIIKDAEDWTGSLPVLGRHFGITPAITDYLFADYDELASPEQVISRIEHVIANNGAIDAPYAAAAGL